VEGAKIMFSRLHKAVEVGNVVRVQTLVAAGADIEEKQLSGLYGDSFTPLHHAALKGYAAVARYLVEQGADKEATSEYGKLTALHVAAHNGHIDVVRMLGEHGAKLDTAEGQGWTPLIFSCLGGHVAVAEYLLEHGCDVDHVNDDGNTALHYAAVHNHLEVAQLLFRWGVKLDVRDSEGKTAADWATQRGHHDIANAIRTEEIRRRDHGFKRDRSTIEGTEEHEAAKRPRVEEQEQQEMAVDEA